MVVAGTAIRLVAAAEPDTTKPSVTPAGLLSVWKEYGLPLPPPDAPLVKFTTGIRNVASDGKETPLYSIGFLLEPGTEKSPAVILAGFVRHEQPRGGDEITEKIEPVAASLRKIEISAELGISAPGSLLGTAVQCEARGWTEFAKELLTRALSQDAGHRFSATYQRAGADGTEALYLAIWQHLQGEAMRPGSERAPVAAKMKRLLDAGHDLPREGGRWLYNAVHAAAQPGKGKPDTPEALIDRLVDSTKGGGAMGGGGEPAANDPYHELESAGFSAVPALLEHIDDPRLTCSMTVGFNNFPSWPRRVGNLVSDLLQDLSGGELGADWLDRQKGAAVAGKAARQWWEEARATGEEQWFLKGAIAKENKDRSFPNACHLRILKARYPQRLADVLRTQMKERPKAQIHPVIAAIDESKLPDAEKAVLFKEAAVHANPETRRTALMALNKYDPAFCNAAAIKAFDAMKKSPREAYWTCPEANLSHLALRTDDEAVWAAFFRAARRADIGLRMELMNPLNYTHVGDKFEKQRLHFLRAFLDDTAQRVRPENQEGTKFTGPCAAFTIPRLRVCDFAAMQAASILNWPDRPDKNWTQDQWEKLRKRVIEALQNK